MMNQMLSPLPGGTDTDLTIANHSAPSSPLVLDENGNPPARRKRIRIRKRRRLRKRGGGGGGGDSGTSTTEPACNTNQQQRNAKKKPHDAPMTKRDIYFCLRCGMIQVAVAEAPVHSNADIQRQRHYAATARLPVQDVVARVTLVNWDNLIVLDTFIKPQPLLPDQKGATEAEDLRDASLFVVTGVLDYRTEQTGVTARHLESAERTVSISQMRQILKRQIKGKILIGHMLQQHLAALGLVHPWCDIRDTAQYAPYMKTVILPSAAQPRSLQSSQHRQQAVYLEPMDLPTLLRKALRWNVVTGGLLGEAIGCLDLYKNVRKEWEFELSVLAQQRASTKRLQQEQERTSMHVAAHQQQQMFSSTEYAVNATSGSLLSRTSAVFIPGMTDAAGSAHGNSPTYHPCNNYAPSYRSFEESSVASSSALSIHEQAQMTIQRTSTATTRPFEQSSNYSSHFSSSFGCHIFERQLQLPQQQPQSAAHTRFAWHVPLHSPCSDAASSTTSCKTPRPPSSSGYGSWTASLPPVSPTREKERSAWVDPSARLRGADESSLRSSESHLPFRGSVLLAGEGKKGQLWIPAAPAGESVDGDGWTSSASDEFSGTSRGRLKADTSDGPSIASGFDGRPITDAISKYGREEDLCQHLPSHLFEDLDETRTKAVTDSFWQPPRCNLASQKQEEPSQIPQLQLHQTSFYNDGGLLETSSGMPDRLYNYGSSIDRSGREGQVVPLQPWSPLLTDSFSLLTLQQNQDSTYATAASSSVRGGIIPPPGMDTSTPVASSTSTSPASKFPCAVPPSAGPPVYTSSSLSWAPPTVALVDATSKRSTPPSSSKVSHDEYLWADGDVRNRSLDSSPW